DRLHHPLAKIIGKRHPRRLLPAAGTMNQNSSDSGIPSRFRSFGYRSRLRIYAITSSRSELLRTKFGMLACDVLKNTPSDCADVDGIAAIAEKVEAGGCAFVTP
ncbi:MAG TPA: hypothetical protein VJY34_11045, partial [Roseiarcus sp.]|nr:hypothetical protein [Roseiarcus sp.]